MFKFRSILEIINANKYLVEIIAHDLAFLILWVVVGVASLTNVIILILKSNGEEAC